MDISAHRKRPSPGVEVPAAAGGVIPLPRDPLGDSRPEPAAPSTNLGARRGSRRRGSRRRGSVPPPVSGRSTPVQVDLAAVFAELVEVAVWTSADGHLQEHASFLLRTGDHRWHLVGFSEPSALELVHRLHHLPGFDPAALLELIGTHSRRIRTLWAQPTGGPDDAQHTQGRDMSTTPTRSVDPAPIRQWQRRGS